MSSKKKNDIYIISILKDTCGYCRQYKNDYWNDNENSWKNTVKKNGFTPWTVDVTSSNENEIRQNLIENGVTYVNTFPFIMAARENKYRADQVFVFCANYDPISKKYIYAGDGVNPCRTTPNFVKWLRTVKSNI